MIGILIICKIIYYYNYHKHKFYINTEKLLFFKYKNSYLIINKQIQYLRTIKEIK